jgi:hypothetical protein
VGYPGFSGIPAFRKEIAAMKTEREMFEAMLTRAGIGHGYRQDHNPATVGYQVDASGVDQVGTEDGPTVEFLFGEDGSLIDVFMCE